jgi:hypothetical protein
MRASSLAWLLLASLAVLLQAGADAVLIEQAPIAAVSSDSPPMQPRPFLQVLRGEAQNTTASSDGPVDATIVPTMETVAVTSGPDQAAESSIDVAAPPYVRRSAHFEVYAAGDASNSSAEQSAGKREVAAGRFSCW